MKTPNFETRYAREIDIGEDISPDSITEKVGYIPANVQIENMTRAGIRLNDYRKEMYDFAPDDPDDDTVTVPLRAPGFDMADASQLDRIIKKSLEGQALSAMEQNEIRLAQEAEKTNTKLEDSVPKV